MKVRVTSTRLALLAAAVLSVVFAKESRAANHFWDPGGATVASTSTNTWELTKWTTSATPTASTVAWVEGSPAMFSAGASTVTNGNYTVIANANHSVAGIFNGDVTDATSSNLQIKGTGILTIAAGVQGFDTQTGGNTTIRNVITGPGTIQTQGGGSLFLYGTNTFTGGIQLNTTSGMNWNNSSSLGTGLITNMQTQAIYATPPNDGGAGATDYAQTLMVMPNDIWPYGAGSSTIIYVGTAPAPIEFAGDIHMTSAAGTTLTLDTRSNTNTFSGVISGAANLKKNSSTGTMILSGSNTFSGSFTMAGPVSVNSINRVSGGVAASSLGHPITAANGIITITTNVTLFYTGAGETTDRVIDMNSTTGGPSIQSDGTGALILAGNITATGAGSKTLTLTGSNTSSNTVSGTIVDNSAANITSVTKASTGTWKLSGANTYSGKTQVSRGTLTVSSLNKVGTPSASSSLGRPITAANGTINLGSSTTLGILQYIGAGETTDRIVNLSGTTGGATLRNDGTGALVFTSDFTATGNGAKSLTLRGSNSAVSVVSGKIVDSTSATSVVKDDSGIWKLTAANTYTGTTTITAGTLQIGNAAAISTGTLAWNTGSLDNVTGSALTLPNAVTFGGNPTYVGSANSLTLGTAQLTGGRTVTVSANTLTSELSLRTLRPVR